MTKSLKTLVTDYEEKKEITEKYAQQLYYSVRRFEKFLGRTATLKDLKIKRVNKWLKYERDQGDLGDRSRANLRRSIVLLWRSSKRPLKVKSIRAVKLEQRNPEAWTYDQLTAIVEAASKIPGVMSNGIERAFLLTTTIWFAYETGVRRQDIWDFDYMIFEGGLTAIITQHKVKRVHTVKITENTLRDLETIATRLKDSGDPHWKTPLRWPQSERQFYYWMRKVREKAGIDVDVKNRALQHLRRTGATEIDIDGGQAWRFLGHSEPGLDRKSYIDGMKTAKPLSPSRNRSNG